MSSPRCSLTCPPRWATRRRPERRTLGPRIGKIAATLGQPLMPWQQQVADVGLELLPSGLPAYREVIVTVPRQNGKTTLVLALEIDRAVGWGRRQRIIYSAQTGRDAREKLLDDQVPLIEASPFRAAVGKVDRANGREGVHWRGGSLLSVVASSEEAGHGKTIGLGVVDEAFSDVDDRREQAMLPAMLTVADAQLWVVSTQGTDTSVYLNRKIDTGRAIAVDDDPDSAVAYFEWSADERADIEDPATWWSCMPALGRTISEAAVRHALATMTEGEFRRAMLNQRTASDERVLGADAWVAVCDPTASPSGALVFAVDCNPERTAGTVVAADRSGTVELVDHQAGTGWIVDRAVRLARKYGAPVALNMAGPAGPFGVELRARQVDVVDVSGANFALACQHLYDAVADRKVRVRPHAMFDAAAAAAQRKTVGDAWVWARRSTDIDISPIVAMSVGVWAALHETVPVFAY